MPPGVGGSARALRPVQEPRRRGVADDPAAARARSRGRPRAGNARVGARPGGSWRRHPHWRGATARSARRRRRDRAAKSARRARAPGSPARAAPSAVRCSSPPESSAVTDRAAARWPVPAPPPPRPAPPPRGQAPVLEPERELGADGARHDLGLGVLEQRADGRRELAGAVPVCVESQPPSPAPRRCRRGSAARARRWPATAWTCPSPIRPRSDQLSRLDRPATPRQRRPRRVRVGVGDVLQPRSMLTLAFPGGQRMAASAQPRAPR